MKLQSRDCVDNHTFVIEEDDNQDVLAESFNRLVARYAKADIEIEFKSEFCILIKSYPFYRFLEIIS